MGSVKRIKVTFKLSLSLFTVFAWAFQNAAAQVPVPLVAEPSDTKTAAAPAGSSPTDPLPSDPLPSDPLPTAPLPVCPDGQLEDSCGVCGGDNSSCLDCSGVPNGSAVMKECGCDDDYSCRECRYFQAEVNEIWLRDDWLTVGSPGEIFEGDGAGLSCLQEILARNESDGRQHGGLNMTDDFVGQHFQEQIGEVRVGDENECYTYLYSVEGKELHQKGLAEDTCTRTHHFVLDSDCNVSSVDPVQVCGSLTVSYIVSPISLDWDDDGSLDDIAPSLVNFPLSPEGKDNWYSWRASGTAPLLVFDPGRSGKVTSAAQLFGNWTFGGQMYEPAFAPAAYSGHSGPSQRWDNGFEALAVLDYDRDGEISGAELKPLALWFDYNRDGKSQTGEVQPVVQKGITALYYHADRQDPATHDIYASAGYARVVEGRVIQGMAVDWYAKSFASKITGALSLGITGADDRGAVHAVERQDAVQSDVASLPSGTISGNWLWRADEGGKDAPSGVLSIAENNGKVAGRAYIEILLQDNSERLRSMIVAQRIFGRLELKDGQTKISFASLNKNGEITKSEASLSADGQQLSGSSVMQAKGNTIAYNWKALRK